MKPIASPLNIIDFAIINFEFNFIEQRKEFKEDYREYFAKYDLDIDFSIHGNETIQVFITAEINRGAKKLPGYSILAEAACLYEFNKDIKVNNEAKHDMGGFSTIYIALNALRGLISQLTANAPLGRFILPSVDLNDLINQKKMALLEKNKKPMPKKKVAQKK